MEFVVPVLNEGLVEVSHMLPDDPVEFLVIPLYSLSNFRLNIYIKKASKKNDSIRNMHPQ